MVGRSERLSGSKVNSGDLASLICIAGFSDLSPNDQANTINSALPEPLMTSIGVQITRASTASPIGH